MLKRKIRLKFDFENLFLKALVIGSFFIWIMYFKTKTANLARWKRHPF